jgi:hypothetical protein
MFLTIEIYLHILIETSVRILLEHNPYVHVLSMSPVDNELEQEQVEAFVRDQRLRAEFKKTTKISK